MCVIVLCVSQTGVGLGVGALKVFSSTSTDGCQRWKTRGGGEEDEDRSLHEGSVSMVIRRRRRHHRPVSAPLKAVLRQQMFVSPGALSWGAVGWVGGCVFVDGGRAGGGT